MKNKIKKVKVIEEDFVVLEVPMTPLKFVTYVLMFTIENHRTWRISMFQKKEDLEAYLLKQPKHPKVTEKRWFACDRITGTITEEK